VGGARSEAVPAAPDGVFFWSKPLASAD